MIAFLGTDVGTDVVKRMMKEPKIHAVTLASQAAVQCESFRASRLRAIGRGSGRLNASLGRLTPSRGRRDSVKDACCCTGWVVRAPRVSARNLSAGGVPESEDVSDGGEGGALMDCIAA